MTTSTRRSAPLPDEAAAYLRSLTKTPDGPETHEEMRTRYRRAAGYRDLLREAGWSLTVMSDAVGVSRQAVSQWGFGVSDREGHPAVPTPPPPPPKPQRPRPPRVSEEDTKRMRELVPLAVQVTHWTTEDDPLRQAAVELSELMAKQIRAGVNLTRVAEAAGQTRNAVAFRLVRYGHSDCVSQWTVDYVNRVTNRRAS
jgi:hypothetical protein